MGKRREYRKADFDDKASKAQAAPVVETADVAGQSPEQAANGDGFQEKTAFTASELAGFAAELGATSASTTSENASSSGRLGKRRASTVVSSGDSSGKGATMPPSRAASGKDAGSDLFGAASGKDASSTSSGAASGKDEDPTLLGAASGKDSNSYPYDAGSESFKEVPPIGDDDAAADLSGLDIEPRLDIEKYLDMDSEYGKLPHPDVFNAYPPEIQRKIMEWTDRDVKARRDDESRRRDDEIRADIDRSRRAQMFPTIITVISLVCAAVTGIVTGNPLFPLVFILVPLAVIAARIAGIGLDGEPDKTRRNKPPRV